MTKKGVQPTREEAKSAVKTLLRFLGDNPERQGLQDTPRRFLDAWLCDWGVGYSSSPPNLKTFDGEDEIINYDQMVIVRDINFSSHCEHHVAPFFGAVDIGYIPDGKIVGISKLARTVDYFSRRLQVQERMTVQIADFLTEGLAPKGVGVVVRALHTCMCSRGVRQPIAKTITSALRGAFLEQSARAEFLRLTQS